MTHWSLLLAVALGAVVAPTGTAQERPDPSTLVWERMPLRPDFGLVINDGAKDMLFLDGVAPDDGGLLWLSSYGPLRYTPGRDDPEWGDWTRLCDNFCAGGDRGVVLGSGTVVWADAGGFLRMDEPEVGPAQQISTGIASDADVLVSTLDALRDPDGRPAIYVGGTGVARSYDDARDGSWEVLSDNTGGDVVVLGEVPPSAALPDGRLLAGVWNGVTFSDDGGATWQAGAGAYGFARFIGHGLAFARVEGHPYGGVVLAGIDDLQYGRDSTATVYRSDDGGATWAQGVRFSPSALGLENANEVRLVAEPDGGRVWASVTYARPGNSKYRTGAVLASDDGGVTWVQAGGYGWLPDGSAGGEYGPPAVNSVRMGPDGRVYVGSVVGVWRTAARVYAVAEEGGPDATGDLGLSVYPNPSDGRAVVAVTGAGPGVVRVSVADVLGREVAVLQDGPLEAGAYVWDLPLGPLAPGVYVVRARTAAATRAAQFSVVR